MTQPDTTTTDPNEEYDYWDPDSGIDKCPRCGQTFYPEGDHVDGPVVDDHGTQYEHIMETDPMDAPFRCPECWKAHCAWERSQENKSLEDYV